MRLLLAALWVAGASAIYCPADQCTCIIGDELEYICRVGANNVTFNARNYEYVNIHCKDTNFTCADLPVLNFGNGQPLSSVSIKGCSPDILPCLNKVLNTPSVTSLTVTEGVAPLEGRHVAALGDVTDIMIVRGADTSIPVSVISSLPTLRRLRISYTRVALKTNDFINASQLEFLEVSEAHITEIPEDVFNGLSNLKILNIWGNNISDVGVNSFKGLESLQSLSLTTNRISHIAAGSLADVPNLTSISLFKNQLRELPPRLFHNLTLLQHVKIQFNDVPLKLNKHTFVNLPSLKTLTIENSGANLPDELLTGCDALQTISLSGNKITSLPPDFFKEFKKLEMLDLSRNKISTLSSNVFSPLKQLKHLNLNRNDLEKLPEFLFSGLRNLNYVSIDDNMLRHIAPLTFQGATALTTVSLKSNKLTLKSQDLYESEYSNLQEEEQQSPFNMLLELKNLYLNGNEIDTMFADWRHVLTKLNNLNLYGNHFTVLFASDCQFLSDNVRVDLRSNNISSVILFDAIATNDTSPNTILLDDNPFMCDCGLYHLAIRTTGLRPVTTKPRFDVGEARCASPPLLKGKLFKNVSPNYLNCDLPPEHCSENCVSCEIRPANKDLAFDCDTLPEPLPNPEDFNLKFLTLKLGVAPESIDDLHLELLNISNIGLHEIPFSPSKTVKAIDLTNNKLTRIPMEFLESNTTLYLANNPFECDCWHSEELAVLKDSLNVRDVASIRCGDKKLVSMDPSELCSSLRAAAVAGLTFLTLLLILVIIAILIYRNSQEILAFIIVKGLCPCCFVDDPEDKEYDVFVSYAHKDRKYVEQLMPKLENEFGLKTCIHYRDWFVGDFIPDQINRSVEKSRKTVILLSNNFLNSGYANMEFRAAHNLAMKEGKNRIILILLEDLSDVVKNNKISEELKAHMKMNTFLKWDDARFSEKLQRALPLRNNKKFVFPEVFKQSGERGGGLNVQLNSDGQLVNMAPKDIV